MEDTVTPLWRRRSTLIIALGIVAALVLWRCAGTKAPAQSYATAAATRGDLIAKVTATGTLSAVVTVEVGSQVSGRVQSLFADFNTQVKKGQRIAKIDPALFEAQVAQAQANVSAARGNILRLQVQADEARRLAKRSATLFEQKIISEIGTRRSPVRMQPGQRLRRPAASSTRRWPRCARRRPTCATRTFWRRPTASLFPARSTSAKP
jgi:HlyD family secretion protein